MTSAFFLRPRPRIGLAGLLALCILAYAASLSGNFLFDDIQQIFNNPALRAIGTPAQNWFVVALSSDGSILRRPISMLSFGANVALFGMSPFAFKLVNVGLHLLNGVLIYGIWHRLARRLIPATAFPVEPKMLALLGAGLWLLHPLNVSGVVYVVQRMNELAAFFSLCGLYGYVDSRERMLRGERALLSALASLTVFGVLAVFSKENGALITIYALVIEACCYRFKAPLPRQRLVLKLFFAAAVALPLALFAGFLVSHPHWLVDSYAVRSFTLPERLLTEARILCAYLLWIVVPNPAWMGFYHDDMVVSAGLLNPPSTLIAVFFLLVLAGAAWLMRKHSPAFTFGVAWFLAGHVMESTILPLEIVFEHRNYLPMAGLLLGITCTFAQFFAARIPARPLALSCIALLLGLAGITAVRAASWGSPLTLALDDARHHPDSSRAQYDAGRELIVTAAASGSDREAAEREALPYFTRSATLDKGQVHPVTERILIRAKHEPVPQPEIAELARRLRAAPTYTQANPFLDMLIAAANEPLSLAPADIGALVDAALANPHFPPMVRAMILNNYGSYKFNIEHDAQGAISLTAAAATEDPTNPYFPINLAKIALALGQAGKAREYLDSARALNKAGFYDQQIRDIESALQ